LVSVYLDNVNDVKPKEVEDAIVPVLNDRDLKIVEMPLLISSSNSTAGLIAADVPGLPQELGCLVAGL
jgi:hypothetical protein